VWARKGSLDVVFRKQPPKVVDIPAANKGSDDKGAIGAKQVRKQPMTALRIAAALKTRRDVFFVCLPARTFFSSIQRPFPALSANALFVCR
jgi:hypothetical protein